MAVLADETGMNSEENDRKCESSHDSNLYFDRQLQNKLLQADEDSDTESYETKLSKSWNNLRSAKSSKFDSRIEDITGWFPSAKFVGRRNDNVAKTETKPTNTFIHPWKDYRSKKEETFVFKHYKEHKKYMEQYRNEHCYQTSRFSSGTPAGEMRRIAFQNSAPSQQSSTVAQNMHQSGHICSAPPSSTNNQSSLYYSNRTEQLGTLITPTSNCTCNNKQSANIGSSQSQRFKVVQGQFSRTNTNYDLRHLESDNSSDSGEPRHRAPSRRTNSASSTRSRTITAKSPTKISVPANPNARAYPVQALTIQQNGKAEVVQAPKPLDNLNCVAPEKQQPGGIEKRPCGEPLELALKIHSLNDLLTVNDNPLRGYALPKSMPPNPNHSNKCLKSQPELDGLTWAEKLQVLRSVNKREKPKPKQQKLKFMKGDPNDPVYLWSFEHDQLYEQRRIRHLVEQARIKGGKQFDWMYQYEAKNSRGSNWEPMMEEREETAPGSGESSEEEGTNEAGDKNLGKYGIYVPPNGVKQKLFNSHNINRSKTFIAP